MASNETPFHEESMLESLRYVIHDINSPFACDGTFVPKDPVAICFPDKTEICVTPAENESKQEKLLRPLVDRCQPAPFGKGRRTLFNDSVRDALQIKAENGAFSVVNFDPGEAGVLEQIRLELTPQLLEPPTAELYNLNMYKIGGHFLSHKDTPRGSDMLGTLVVCLPSQFSDGAFVLKHHGVLKTYNWGKVIRQQVEPMRIHWVAFFGDVDHEVERVRAGLRVTVTYLLRYPSNTRNESIPVVVPDSLALKLGVKFHDLLNDAQFLPQGGVLAFPCSHMYSQDLLFKRKQSPISSQTVAHLKGRDHEIAAAALAKGLEVNFFPYMIESCVDETWQLEHFPTAKERSRLRCRMDPDRIKNALAVRDEAKDDGDFDVIWVDPPPSFNSFPRMYPRGATEIDIHLPSIDHLHSCEYSVTGYFGNEATSVDFYVYSALHVFIPPYVEGTRVGVRRDLSSDGPSVSSKPQTSEILQ